MTVRQLDSSIASLLSPQPTSGSSAASSATSTDAVPTDSADVSSGAKLLEQLKALEASDPSRFQAVTASIAQQLQTQAQSATGGQANFLNDLSTRFQQASTSGDLSALQFSKPSSGGARVQGNSGPSGTSGHRHHAKYAASEAGGASSADPLQSIIENALQQVGVTTDTSRTSLG